MAAEVNSDGPDFEVSGVRLFETHSDAYTPSTSPPTASAFS
jgi:hypothetical protein